VNEVLFVAFFLSSSDTEYHLRFFDISLYYISDEECTSATAKGERQGAPPGALPGCLASPTRRTDFPAHGEYYEK
jgi:hypothetical protein